MRKKGESGRGGREEGKRGGREKREEREEVGGEREEEDNMSRYQTHFYMYVFH